MADSDGCEVVLTRIQVRAVERAIRHEIEQIHQVAGMLDVNAWDTTQPLREAGETLRAMLSGESKTVVTDEYVLIPVGAFDAAIGFLDEARRSKELNSTLAVGTTSEWMKRMRRERTVTDQADLAGRAKQ